jgi:hypothetical protein
MIQNELSVGAVSISIRLEKTLSPFLLPGGQPRRFDADTSFIHAGGLPSGASLVHSPGVR